MRRLLAVLLATGHLFLMVTPPSSAIFGLSKCEKMWKAIDSEEAVGKIQHEDFTLLARYLDKKASYNNFDIVDTIDSLNEVLASDRRVYRLAVGSSSCFTAKQMAWIRTALQSTNQRIADNNSRRRELAQRQEMAWYKPQGFTFIKLYERYFKLKQALPK